LVFGINSDREHVDAGVADVDRGPVTDVVVDSIETLGETHSEIRDRLDTIVESGADLHLNDTGVVIDSETGKSVLGVLDSLDRGGVELQRAAKVQDVRDWLGSKDLPSRGRAPLGFTYDDGEVVTAENYDDVRAVLSLVLDDSPDGLSKRKAAEKLGVAPRTIGRALDNLGRYGLEEEEGDSRE
jgi:DNA invertase Pin-like site-specific DNA recombinase